MRKFLLFTTIFLMEKAFAELLIAERYHLAVTDAAIVKAEGKTDQLWPITTDNSHLVWNEDKTKLVVVLWMNYVDYNRYVKYFTKTPDYRRFKFWVTAAPQVKNFCKQLTQLSDVDLDLRLKQYLGLPPNFNFDVFIELWVSPESLFRPCIDPEITDNKCEDIIPDNFTDTDHGKFYQQLYFDTYGVEIDSQGSLQELLQLVSLVSIINSKYPNKYE